MEIGVKHPRERGGGSEGAFEGERGNEKLRMAISSCKS
jgi:hypothetical protein